MSAPKLHFCTATQVDALRIQQLIQSAFRTEDSREDWTGNMELASNFRVEVEEVEARISNDDVITLMAVDSNNALVGSIEVSKRGTDCGRLSMIAVDDRYQRGGVGRQILSYAEDFCQQTWGVTRFSLNALSTRPALIEWYLRCGYQKTGETSPFPREKFSNISLPDDMCFIELEKDFGGIFNSN
jgi:GNAT superfamily N-acetyltransferase